jgi:MFS family permease
MSDHSDTPFQIQFSHKYSIWIRLHIHCNTPWSNSNIQVANLYYNQPILIHLSETFNVDYDKISNVPSLTQAGYAGALLLISPLGDLVKRRPLILLLCIAGAVLSIGLAVTNSLTAFEALSFIIGFISVRNLGERSDFRLLPRSYCH